jgi:hypothetical protein
MNYRLAVTGDLLAESNFPAQSPSRIVTGKNHGTNRGSELLPQIGDVKRMKRILLFVVLASCLLHHRG